MAYRDLRAFLDDLGDDLLRLPQEFDPRFEIAAALREAGANGGPALLFENVRGYPDARVAGNLLGTRRRLARALGTTEAQLVATYLQCKEHSLPPTTVSGSVPVKEVVKTGQLDVLSELPVLTHYEKDAAPFITSGVVMARDPESGGRGMGIHRMMVKGGNRLSVFFANPPLAHYLARAEAQGRALEVAAALGVEPALLLAAVVSARPQGPDKLEIAGGLRGEPVELAPAETVGLQLPARAEAIIEGRVLPGLREPEGPFGENTGYYFSNDSPVLEVTAITHRQDFIYPGLCPWTAEVDNILSLAAGTELMGRLQALMGGVIDLELTPGTSGFSAVIAVRDYPPAEARRLISLALNLERRLKSVTVVDEDVDIRDPREVAWAMATRYQPHRDTVLVGGVAGYVIDPSAGADAAKIGFDATRGAGPQFDKITIPPPALQKARAVLGR